MEELSKIFARQSRKVRGMRAAFTLAEGRPACTTTQVPAKGGQVRSYTSKVSKVSTVSEVSKMSKQGEQQLLHSLLPMGEGGRRPDEGADYVRSYMETAKEVRSTSSCSFAPWGEGDRRSDEGLKETVRCNSDEMLKQVQHDGISHVKETNLTCPPLETLPNINNPVDCLCERKPEFSIPRRGTKNYDVTHHKAAEPKNVKDLTSYRPNVLTTSKKAAFTLAEVLITLAVIGVVAVLTIPGLIKNHNEKAWATAKDLWEKKLTETVRRMNTDGVMTGHDTTEDFMDTFKQYMKVIKTCDNNDLNKCYSPEFVLTGKRDNLEKKYIEDFKTANDLGVSDWNTNTMSFVISDGTTVIAAYNPNCPYADPIEDTGSQVACLSMMIDVNGKKSPNRVGKDILLSNATISTCDNPIGDLCFSTDFLANTILNTCSTGTEEDKAYDTTGDDNFYCEYNYWAGAKKTCAQKNMSLATLEQLAQLASNLYVDSSGNKITIGETTNKTGIKVNDEYSQNPPITLDKIYWSGDGLVGIANCRTFYTDSTEDIGLSKNYNTNYAVCVGN